MISLENHGKALNCTTQKGWREIERKEMNKEQITDNSLKFFNLLRETKGRILAENIASIILQNTTAGDMLVEELLDNVVNHFAAVLNYKVNDDFSINKFPYYCNFTLNYLRIS